MIGFDYMALRFLRVLSRSFRVVSSVVLIGLSLFVLASIANGVSAQELSPELEKMVRDRASAAPVDADALRERLQILSGAYDLPEGIAELGVKALEDERVRSLLGAGTADMAAVRSSDQERYMSDVVVFASFSMPDPSLKALLYDAAKAGVPVVFRGFVNNSVLDTEAAVRALYTYEDQSQGFLIDPTLFERFDVAAVPVVVSITEEIDVCVTAGCSEDPVPGHDKVSGNVPLSYALEIIAKGNGEGAVAARLALERLQ